MLKSILVFIKKRKITFAVIVIILIAAGYYTFGGSRNSAAETRYTMGTVTKGTIITSITGTGQVSVSHQVDIKTKAGGDVVNVTAQKGQAVKNGAVLAYLDDSDAERNVRDARINLESAKISLEKLAKPATDLEIIQAKNALTQAEETKENAEADLEKAYDDGFNKVSNAFLDMPDTITGLYGILYNFSFSQGQSNIDFYADHAKQYDEKATDYRNNADLTYQTARKTYDANFIDYKATTRLSDKNAIEKLITETYETAKSMAEAIKSSNNLIQFYEDLLTKRSMTPDPLANTHLSGLNAYTGTINTHLLDLLSIRQTIENDKKTILDAERTIAEKTESLAELRAGADPLDIDAQKLTIQQKENALADAQTAVGDYIVRAPFDGVIADMAIKKGDNVSSGATAGTLITTQRTADISLNEVDVAKVQVGQKTTLTFDAIEDLSITGEVADIDIIGTVSQGVVTYNVTIVFDTQDERVKPGMSVSAAIITEARQDVLLIPNGALKNQDDIYYVQMFDSPLQAEEGQSVTSAVPPRDQQVEIGIANDDYTEIVSGLKDGDQIVTRVISGSSSTKTTTSSASGLFGTGGGGMRMPH
jgi:HlyD family secretion protein